LRLSVDDEQKRGRLKIRTSASRIRTREQMNGSGLFTCICNNSHKCREFARGLNNACQRNSTGAAGATDPTCLVVTGRTCCENASVPHIWSPQNRFCFHLAPSRTTRGLAPLNLRSPRRTASVKEKPHFLRVWFQDRENLLSHSGQTELPASPDIYF